MSKLSGREPSKKKMKRFLRKKKLRVPVTKRRQRKSKTKSNLKLIPTKSYQMIMVGLVATTLGEGKN